MKTLNWMKTFILLPLLFLLVNCNPVQPKEDYIQLTEEEYHDRIKAMWMAQLIAVHMGWDFEHKPAAVGNIQGYTGTRLKLIEQNGGAEVDDDWYYEMVALAGFEKYGIDMTVEELGQQWLDYNMGTWGSAFYTRQALLSGLKGADAGHPKNNRMWFTVGNQNRSDLYAMITPGMPNLTASLSRELGHVNSYAEGTDGGVLMGVIESMAFYEKDVQQLIKNSLKVLDPATPHRRCYETIIAMGEEGKSWQETARAIEERWGIEYPGTNSAVWNSGFAGVALWFGEGDLMKSLNIAYQASDFSDADCQAANVATVLAAIHGTKIFTPDLLEPFNNRIKGDKLGFMDLVEPVDENLDTLAARTVRIGKQLLAANGARVKDGNIQIPVQREIVTQPLEYFHPNEFTRYWNPEWQMDRAGFGAPGGGVRGIRGGTFIDGDVLSTYPRDEVRGVKLSRALTIGENQMLKLDVAADPGRKWILNIYINHKKILTKLIEGGDPLNWPDVLATQYPQPLHEYQESAKLRKWNTIQYNLVEYHGQEVTIRLYQDILVRNGFPGNAYWRNLEIVNSEGDNNIRKISD